MREIRSLVLSRWRPDAAQGGASLRNLQNISGLAALGPVDVLTIGKAEAPADVPGVRRWMHFERAPARGRLPGSWLFDRAHHPLLAGFQHPAAAAFLVQSLATRSYDLVLLEEIACTSYLPLLKAHGATVVFDNHNVEAPLRQTLGGRDDRRDRSNLALGTLRARVRQRVHNRRIGSVERRALRTADMVWACSTVDADELGRLYGPCAPIRVVPNAVDVAAFSPARARRIAQDSGAQAELVYVGSYAYYPNEEAALRLVREVMPALRARGVGCRVTLVGRSPTDAMLAAASEPDVTVTGAVDSILPYLSGASIMVVPIAIGSGTRFKILEAFAAACPVVSTRKGAEGIDAEDGIHLLLRETPAAIADAIASLRSDPGAAARMTESALALVRNCYSWEAAAQRIASSLSEIASLAN